MLKRAFFPAAGIAAVAALNVFEPKVPKYRIKSDPQKRASQAVRRFMLRNGVPGLSVGVSVNGKCVWATGFGYADAEQLVPCTERTVMRIASISKSITAVIAARLVQAGKLDLDAPIKTYLPDYPIKKRKAVPVDITSRQLLSHTSGIRHYPEDTKPNSNIKKVENDKLEFYSNKEYEKVEDALEIFKNDDLISEPGEKFKYTTYGYTLLSAVLEKVAGEPFTEQAKKLFRLLGMNDTRLDRNREIISHRTRYYFRDERGRLCNSPEVNNSCKWAGGGFLSTVRDLLTFADAMLYSFNLPRYPNSGQQKPLLKATVLETFWKGEVIASRSKNYRYALGWYKNDDMESYGGTNNKRQHCSFWMHTGGGVGASSILFIKPDLVSATPSGICIAILTNLQDCGELTQLALEIADIFQE